MAVRSRVILSGLLLFLGLSSALHALDGSETFTLDLPFAANQATPAWLGHPSTPSTTFATLDLPVAPPDATSSLLVTVFFEEKNGGFLRVSWETAPAPTGTVELPSPGEASASSVLCDNLYEGIGMSNQRSLLISPDAMKQPGVLRFQCGDTALGISRIKLEWLQNSTGLSSPTITDTLVTPASGKTQLSSDLTGQPPPAADASWHDRIVNVPVTDQPLRIEQGVDFTVQMDGVPTLARLAVKEAGLPWGQHLAVWINNQRAGVVMPEVPSLDDAGYPDEKGSTYVGWRPGTFYVPAGLLIPGSNTVQFSAEPDVPPSTPADPNAAPIPLAVKNVGLQLDYLPNSTALASVAPVIDSAPATNVPVSEPAPTASVVTPPSPSTTPDPTPAPNLPVTPSPTPQDPGLLSLPATAPSASSSTTNTP